jgi:hypothetical protein
MLHGKRGFQDVIKDPEMERLSRWAQCHHQGPLRQRQASLSEKLEDYTADFEDGGRGHEPRKVSSLQRLTIQGNRFY